MRTEPIPNTCLSRAAWLLCAMMAVSISACTGGSDSDSESDAPNTPADSSTPDSAAPGDPAPITLAGTPVTTVSVGSEYRFRPQVSGAAAGATLSFSVANLPDWASFDTGTGEIAGMPLEADVGAWNEILITVSDGQRSASLDAFGVEVVAVALGTAQLSWTAPTENADNTPLTDLAGFRVYWGEAADELSYSVQIDNPSVSMYLVENLAASQWFFAVTAIDSAGNESALSEVISGSIGGA